MLFAITAQQMLPVLRNRGVLPKLRIRSVAAAAFLCVTLFDAHISLAEDSVLHSIELCNGIERSTAGSQIRGCTAVINSKAATSVGLAIAYNNRADAYISEGKYDLALADYDRAVVLNPRFAKAYNNRGVAYAKTGELDRALQNFAAAIELDGHYANPYVNRADVYLRQLEFQKASSDYDAALKIKSDLSKAWSGRCWARAQIGKLPEALKDCEEALRNGPDTSALQARGFIHLKMKQWDAATSDYEAALKREPKLAAALYGRGLASLHKGDRNGAQADMAAAQQLDSTVSTSFKTAGLE